ncbi:YjcQ family protein [Lentibacillus jeotgali]|uniref:YjcQ family protein n=1 Tax=Lentibacillus jeotgali TaxID=558169 RepID=UPI0002627822|nr:YjcQ family protein [Lentibacillus jeotgali]
MGFSRRKLRYSIIKEFDKGERPTHETFGVNQEDYVKFLRELQDDGYITGITFTKTSLLGRPRPTPLGEKYVDENSPLARSYRTAKELRDWIRL